MQFRNLNMVGDFDVKNGESLFQLNVESLFSVILLYD